MITNIKKIAVILISFLLLSTAHAEQKNTQEFNLLNTKKYYFIVSQTRNKIISLLNILKQKKISSNENFSDKNFSDKHFADKHFSDKQIAFVINQLTDIPYAYDGAMGEGDWQPTSLIYKNNAIHVNQNPVYRLDKLNCQTFVQMVMALSLSNNLNQFDKNILKISYGAAGNPHNEIVRYFNRNNFVEADFNFINQKNNLLVDALNTNSLVPYTKILNLNITRQQWFLNKLKYLSDTVEVLHADASLAMIKRYRTVYTHLNFPHFKYQQVQLRYIPKELLAIKNSNGSYYPNQTLINKIPTPSIAEIVRDAEKWKTNNGVKVKDIVGSDLAISHLGFLYKQTFNQGDLIYHQVSCLRENKNRNKNESKNKNLTNCKVVPVVCKTKQCNELMFAHATAAYPHNFFWYKNKNGKHVCSGNLPEKNIKYTSCNRVVSLPFFAYLTEHQFGWYGNMEMPSIVGVHVEALK